MGSIDRMAGLPEKPVIEKKGEEERRIVEAPALPPEPTAGREAIPETELPRDLEEVLRPGPPGYQVVRELVDGTQETEEFMGYSEALDCAEEEDVYSVISVVGDALDHIGYGNFDYQAGYRARVDVYPEGNDPDEDGSFSWTVHQVGEIYHVLFTDYGELCYGCGGLFTDYDEALEYALEEGRARQEELEEELAVDEYEPDEDEADECGSGTPEVELHIYDAGPEKGGRRSGRKQSIAW